MARDVEPTHASSSTRKDFPHNLEGRAFSGLLASLTHELKTPLHSMLSLASVLASEIDGELNSEQKRQVEMIRKNGEQLLEMLTEVLHFSSLSFRSGRLSLESFDIKSLSRDILASVEPIAQQKGVALESDFSALNTAFISDKFYIRQIVSNLLSNAVKYSPEGTSVGFFAETLGDGALRFQIVDSGIGIPPQMQEQIFEEFYQVDTEGQAKFRGVGLGLALVKASVAQLGGTIELKSERGQGSLFSVRIPSSAGFERKAQVLIIDSDKRIQASLSAALNTGGYSSIALANDEITSAKLQEINPCIILLDFDAVKKEQSGLWLDGGEIEAVPIIVLSAVDGPQQRDTAKNFGACEFVTKPFDVDDLLARVKRHLE